MRRILLGCMLALLAAPSLAQTKPAMDLPKYPGAEAGMEINLTKDDLLPTLNAMLPLLLSGAGKAASALNPDEIIAIFKDVDRVQYLQLDAVKPAATESDVLRFYQAKLPKGEWYRVFYTSTAKEGTISIYSERGGTALYGFRVQSVVQDKRKLRHVDIARIDGPLDFQKLPSLIQALSAAGITAPK